MRADLHIHTFHSKDNHQTIQEIFEAAKRKDLRAIAITDHNTTVGAAAVMKAAPEWLIVLPGIEITSDDGHILALNVEQEIPKGLSALETIGRIHDAGGIAVAAHPYRKWSGLKESSIRTEPVRCDRGDQRAQHPQRQPSRPGPRLGDRDANDRRFRCPQAKQHRGCGDGLPGFRSHQGRHDTRHHEQAGPGRGIGKA